MKSAIRSAAAHPPGQDVTRPPDLTPAWPEVDDVSAAAPVYLTPNAGWYTAVKPAVEAVAGIGLMLVALPLLLVGWALIRLTSRGPGFYFQSRAGWRNRPYTIVKIRSMYHTPEVAKNTDWAKLTGDARVTPVGRILRALHLDELPQLFNVLRGEMSLVGPRPERPEVIARKQLIDLVPGYAHRTTVRPGVTGLAQVQLPGDTDVTSVRHKVYYDLYYLSHQSLWLDARICAATLLKSFLSPDRLRRVLLLPTREQVCAHFLTLLTPPEPGTEPVPNPVTAA